MSGVQIAKFLTTCPACLGAIIGLARYKVEVPEEENAGTAKTYIDAKLVLNEMEINHHCRKGRDEVRST